MSTTAATPATTPIPVQLSDSVFPAFILPHLSMPKRGPRCKLGYHRIFNLIRAGQAAYGLAHSAQALWYGAPDEVARMMLCLASDESSFCTGGVYMIDGGMSAGPS